MPIMMRRSIVYMVLLVALVGQQGLAHLDPLSHSSGGAYPSVSGVGQGQGQEHLKNSVENFLNKNKNQELLDLLHLHNSLAIDGPEQDSLVSFDGSNFRAGNSQAPKVHEWSNEHVDPLTGARSSSAARTVLHEAFRSSHDNHHHDPAGHKFSTSSGLPGHTHSLHDVLNHHNHHKDRQAADNVHGQHLKHLFNNEQIRGNHFVDRMNSGHQAGLRMHEANGLNTVNHMSSASQHESMPVNERVHETYIDHSDPYNPKQVHYEREAKSRVGPNSATHERREMMSSKSLGGHNPAATASSPVHLGGSYDSHHGNEFGSRDPHWHSHGHEHKHRRNKHLHDHVRQHSPHIPPLPSMPDVQSFHPFASMSQPHVPFMMTPHGLSLNSVAGSWPAAPTSAAAAAATSASASASASAGGGVATAAASASATGAGFGSSSGAPGHHHAPLGEDFDPYDVDAAHSHRSKLSKKAKKHLRKIKSKRDRKNYPIGPEDHDIYNM